MTARAAVWVGEVLALGAVGWVYGCWLERQ